MGQSVLVKVKGVSMTVKSGEVFTLDDREFLRAARSIFKVWGTKDFKNNTKTLIKYIEKHRRAKKLTSRPKAINQEIVRCVKDIYKRTGDLQKARIEFSKSPDLKRLVGDKRATISRVKNAFQKIYGTEDLERLKILIKK